MKVDYKGIFKYAKFLKNLYLPISKEKTWDPPKQEHGEGNSQAVAQGKARMTEVQLAQDSGPARAGRKPQKGLFKKKIELISYLLYLNIL